MAIICTVIVGLVHTLVMMTNISGIVMGVIIMAINRHIMFMIYVIRSGEQVEEYILITMPV